LLQNCVLIGKKQCDYWIHCLDMINDMNIDKKFYETQIIYVCRTTGPLLLTNAYKKYKNDKIKIISYKNFEPISWCDYEIYNCFNTSCKMLIGDNSYAIHHYGSKNSTNNWIDNTEQTIAKSLCKYKHILYTSVIVIMIYLIYNYLLPYISHKL